MTRVVIDMGGGWIDGVYSDVSEIECIVVNWDNPSRGRDLIVRYPIKPLERLDREIVEAVERWRHQSDKGPGNAAT
jgi:hypothetical protein